MMTIEYTMSSVKGEPGPNIYWRGAIGEYYALLGDLRLLGMYAQHRVDVGKIPYITLVGFKGYRLKSTQIGGIVSQVDGDGVITDLTCEYWQEFLHKVLSISFEPGFVYQEFDGQGFREEANVIMESSK